MMALLQSCLNCSDSGIALTSTGPVLCESCPALHNTKSMRLYGAISHRQLRNQKIDDAMLALARALVPASAAAPILGETLAPMIGAKGDLRTQLRYVKRLAQRLRQEWQLPVCGRREAPYGYFFASTPQEFLDWMRTTRNQAISELATAYQLFKTNFPELAGQKSLEFVETVSTELQEAIR